MVQGLFFWPSPLGEAASAMRDLLAITRRAHDFGAEEDEIIRERRDQRDAIGVRTTSEAEEEKRCGNPREPLHLRRQNEKNVNDFVGIKVSKSKEERRVQHQIGKIAPKEKGRDRRSDHPEEIKKIEPESAPGALEAFADKPEEEKNEDNPDRGIGGRDENVGDEAPDLAVQNCGAIQCEN